MTMDEHIIEILLGLIATLIAAGVWTHKRTVTRGDQHLGDVINSLRKAVDSFADFRAEEQAVHGAMIADLRSIALTQEKILEIQERILREVRALNGKEIG